ncbi:MAG: OsmC family protein [Bryobacteraceae bacterium]
MIVGEFTISIEQVKDYEFHVRFDKAEFAPLVMDEPPPLGRHAGPNAARVLAAAIGNCLSASLVFCAARRAGIKLENVRTQVKVQMVRNENKRLRVGTVEVTIDPGLGEEERARLRECIGLFEDFCTVTESVRAGMDVRVKVKGFEEAASA